MKKIVITLVVAAFAVSLPTAFSHGGRMKAAEAEAGKAGPEDGPGDRHDKGKGKGKGKAKGKGKGGPHGEGKGGPGRGGKGVKGEMPDQN